MEKVTIWKRFRGWVTASKNKYAIYRENLLFVTRVKTLAVHLSFVIFLLVIFWLFLDYAEEQILREVVHALEVALREGADSTATNFQTLSSHLKLTYALFFVGMLGVMSVVLYFLAGVTLRPIRKNMESQRRFIADVSHELRTPLAVMQTEAEVSLLEGANDDDRTEALRVNIEEISRISLIINNLVSFTHVSGLTPASFSRVELSSVVGRAVAKLQTVATKGDVTITVNCPNLIFVYGNEIALEQVVLNLVKNAITHTTDKGEVKVACSVDADDMACIEVADTGEGIPEEDISKIFEAFFKSGKAKISDHGNVGLGLTIVKEVIRSHNGSIDVDSTLGEGTTMTVYLPLLSQRKE